MILLSPSITSLRCILATFHKMIEDAIPQIVNLLKDSNSNIRSAGANTLGKLAEQSK